MSIPYVEFMWVVVSGLVAVAGLVLLVRYRKYSALAPYRRVISNLPDGCAILADGKIAATNPALSALLGRPGDELVGEDPYDVLGGYGITLPPRELVREQLKSSGRRNFIVPVNGGRQPRFGELDIVSLPGGRDRFLVFVREVTERVRSERKLLRRDMQFQKAMEMAGFGSWIYDVASGRQHWSDELKEIFGINTPILEEQYTRGEPGFSLMHPSDDHVRQEIVDSLNAGEDPAPCNFRIIRPDGEIRHVEAHVGRLLDNAGALVQVVTIFRDITDDIEREQQLRHAQKMEAIGQLTGGLAHDFNNLLHVILGNLELMDKPASGRERAGLEAIERAATRGAELTQRLLAYARRQVLDFQVVNINDCVSDLVPMLERTLGEAVTVDTRLGEGAMECRVDVGQLESCIVNLALNAHHAMPSGGRLCITTRRVDLEAQDVEATMDLVPGPYVLLEVIDDGDGMPQEIVERAFEPFFTTRNTGEGSGLGLSMVFGVIKQSKGHVRIDSETGEGTRVSLFLPIVEGASTPANDATRAHAQYKGKVLLVEDDPMVAELTAHLLSAMGFEVICAADASEASAAMLRHDDFGLLVTDVILPGGENGPVIAANFARKYPAARILYMSGYTQNALGEGVLEDDVILLHKPFGRTELAEKVAAAFTAAQD